MQLAATTSLKTCLLFIYKLYLATITFSSLYSTVILGFFVKRVFQTYDLYYLHHPILQTKAFKNSKPKAWEIHTASEFSFHVKSWGLKNAGF